MTGGSSISGINPSGEREGGEGRTDGETHILRMDFNDRTFVSNIGVKLSEASP
jgi:hypothetical protein